MILHFKLKASGKQISIKWQNATALKEPTKRYWTWWLQWWLPIFRPSQGGYPGTRPAKTSKTLLPSTTSDLIRAIGLGIFSPPETPIQKWAISASNASRIGETSTGTVGTYSVQSCKVVGILDTRSWKGHILSDWWFHVIPTIVVIGDHHPPQWTKPPTGTWFMWCVSPPLLRPTPYLQLFGKVSGQAQLPPDTWDPGLLPPWESVQITILRPNFLMTSYDF